METKDPTAESSRGPGTPAWHSGSWVPPVQRQVGSKGCSAHCRRISTVKWWGYVYSIAGWDGLHSPHSMRQGEGLAHAACGRVLQPPAIHQLNGPPLHYQDVFKCIKYCKSLKYCSDGSNIKQSICIMQTHAEIS